MDQLSPHRCRTRRSL
ncbi:hypothetical protein QN226_00110 [Sinorhizobium sp. 6-117]|nr:hypothetical protein [Sinorhizobium sp. 6-117]MDK1477117.1 hypothetical protein [Sinorhizobium sp. 6-117]